MIKPGGRNAYSIAVVCAIATSASFLSGCFLFNDKNAVPETTRMLAQTIARDARFNDGTNMVRGSAGSLYARMVTLFPRAKERGILRLADFDDLLSVGAARSWTEASRPTSPVALMTFRKVVDAVCLDDLSVPSTDTGTLYSEGDVLMEGETLPAATDEPLRTAFVAVRNALLYPYPANSEVVQIVATGYRGSMAARQAAGESVTGSRNQARREMCIQLLMAPQFLLGNPGPGDGVRRTALELARRRPTFREFSDILSGRRQVSDWVGELQQSENYFSTVKAWHRDSLGLRPFMHYSAYPLPPTQAYIDPRSGYLVGRSRASEFGLNPRAFTIGHYASDGNPNDFLKILKPEVRVYEWGRASSEHIPFLTGSVPAASAIQEFDPRTSMVVFETRPYASGQKPAFSARAAWILDSLSPALLDNTYPGLRAGLPCAAMTPSFPRNYAYYGVPPAVTYYDRPATAGYTGNGAFPTYQWCEPQGSTFSTTVVGADFITPEAERACDAAPPGTNCAGKTVQRIRRYSPRVVGARLDEQNGVSPIRLMFSNELVYVANGMTRFFYTCAFRPTGAARGVIWSHGADYYSHFPGTTVFGSASYPSMDFIASPYLLNQFKCGKTDWATLSNGGATEEQLFPRGYDPAPAVYSLANNQPVPSNLNDLQFMGRMISYPKETPTLATTIDTRNEGGSFLRLRQDVENEPLNLLEYIIRNRRPYTELVNADYSVGGPELELLYRMQAYELPAYPPGAEALAVEAGNHTPGQTPSTWVRRFQLRGVPPLPSRAVRGVAGASDASGLYQPIFTGPDDLIQPKPAAGVLTMPAFLGPVSTSGLKMRSIAARIFSRLTCREPVAINLTQSQKNIHSRYIASRTNASNDTLIQHLDQKTLCFGCHVHLDPLSQALGPRFLERVQVNENQAAQGEMWGTFDYMTGRPWLGFRGGLTRGHGAFLGKEAEGFEGVGNVLAESNEFARCTVETAFQNVFGRAPAFLDLPLIEKTTEDFKNNGYEYNAMIRYLVSTKLFNREQ